MCASHRMWLSLSCYRIMLLGDLIATDEPMITYLTP